MKIKSLIIPFDWPAKSQEILTSNESKSKDRDEEAESFESPFKVTDASW